MSPCLPCLGKLSNFTVSGTDLIFSQTKTYLQKVRELNFQSENTNCREMNFCTSAATQYLGHEISMKLEQNTSIWKDFLVYGSFFYPPWSSAVTLLAHTLALQSCGGGVATTRNKIRTESDELGQTARRRLRAQVYNSLSSDVKNKQFFSLQVDFIKPTNSYFIWFVQGLLWKNGQRPKKVRQYNKVSIILRLSLSKNSVQVQLKG